MKLPALVCYAALAIAMAGCATAPQSQYYTLVAPAERLPADVPQAPFAIDISSVEVPQQVDRPQIVLSLKDGAQVTLLNDSQWAAPLSDEVRSALSRKLSRKLGTLQIDSRVAPKKLPLWQLSVTVNRFESVYGNHALLEATWRQAPRNGADGASAICSVAIQVPVEQGMPSLVEGHQRALDELARLMAKKLQGQPLDAAAGVSLKGCV